MKCYYLTPVHSRQCLGRLGFFFGTGFWSVFFLLGCLKNRWLFACNFWYCFSRTWFGGMGSMSGQWAATQLG